MANHEEIYRGKKAMLARQKQQIVVFGVGAVGSLLVDHLARMGFSKIAIYDKDRVEADNVLSQIYSRKDVGQLKVNAMKNMVFLATSVQLEVEHRAVTAENIVKIVKKFPTDSLFIDCFDNEISRRVLFHNIKNCLHIGLASEYAEIVWNDIYRVPKKPAGIDVCEYPQARNTTLMAVGTASEILISYFETGNKQSVAFTLNDLKITPY